MNQAKLHDADRPQVIETLKVLSETLAIHFTHLRNCQGLANAKKPASVLPRVLLPAGTTHSAYDFRRGNEATFSPMFDGIERDARCRKVVQVKSLRERGTSSQGFRYGVYRSVKDCDNA